jgi:hypothetical protein
VDGVGSEAEADVGEALLDDLHGVLHLEQSTSVKAGACRTAASAAVAMNHLLLSVQVGYRLGFLLEIWFGGSTR